jgi:hypothetical protein
LTDGLLNPQEHAGYSSFDSRDRALESLRQLADSAAQAAVEKVARMAANPSDVPEDPAALVSLVDARMMARDPQWAALKGPVAEVVAANPQLIPNTMDSLEAIENGLSLAAGLVRGAVAQHQLAVTRRQEEARSYKRRAQTLSGAGAGRAEPISDDEEFFSRLKAAHRAGRYSVQRSGW